MENYYKHDWACSLCGGYEVTATALVDLNTNKIECLNPDPTDIHYCRACDKFVSLTDKKKGACYD